MIAAVSVRIARSLLAYVQLTGEESPGFTGQDAG